nr:patatin-like phospholipase family protein [Trinickia dinghuensis]
MSNRGAVRTGRTATLALVAVALLTARVCAHAQAAVCRAQGGPGSRPSIGLVLSGGGARGYAHLGVLRVLEESRIPVDCIAGTSMGAVVGGLYASGMTADAMQARLEHVNLADIAFDVEKRADLPQSQREDSRLYVGSVGFGADGVKLPAGLVQGNRLQALLQEWTSTLPLNAPFDTLPIPYRAIATNLSTGDEVVLDHGSLPLAIRASMAMPGLFAPTELDGAALVDGGLVNNLPTDVARSMGAQVLIAVDISSPLRPLDALSSPTDVMQQMLGILIHQNVGRHRAQLTPNDVLIKPALGNLSFSDFARANEAIEAGASAARAVLPQLRRFALTPEQYAAYRAAHVARRPQPVRLAHIDVHTRGDVPAERVSKFLDLHPGEVYDPLEVNRDLQTLVTSGDFETATQQLIDDPDGPRLVIDAKEKSWGPNFLLFGLGLSSSSEDEGGFRLNLGYRRPWLTPSGLELRADSTLGSDLLRFNTELRQPLSASMGYYVAPYAEFERRFASIYDDDTGVRLTQYHLQSERVGVDFGLPLARLGDFRIGLAYSHAYGSAVYNIPLDDGSLLYPDVSGREVSARAKLVIDQLDDPLFPRTGYFTELRVERSVFGQSSPFIELYGKAIGAVSLGRHSFNASVEAGGDIGGQNAANPLGFTLGGFQHLSAYAADQLSGNSMLYAQLTYLNQLMQFESAPLEGLYAGVSFEAGNVWQQGDRFASGALKRSVTLFTSVTSSFGPLYFGVALAPGGRRNIYFQLGHTY